MSDIQTWSTTAASNNATPPNGFPEGMAPSTVNDAAREVMAAVARYRSDTDGVNTSAGTNTITLAASRAMTAYAQGDMYTFKAGGTNTGATTLNVDSLGAKNVQFNGAACTGGEIVSGLMYTVVYDGTQFQMMNASSYPAIDITSLEVTNIKAKDGTAALVIANSTGTITALTQFNAAIAGIDTVESDIVNSDTVNATTVDATTVEVTNINAKDGAEAISISNVFGNVSFSGSIDVNSGITSDAAVTCSSPVPISTGSFRDNFSGVAGGGLTSHVSFKTSATAILGAMSSYSSFVASGMTTVALGSSLTTQYGFVADNTLTTATTNYGFYSDIASGTGRWNFYANGTASNYFGGNTIVSVTDNTNAALRVTQLGTANALEIEDSANPDATPFIVNASGQLIQGNTAAVATKLGTTSSTPFVQMHGTLQQTAAFASYGYSASNLAGFLCFNRSTSGSVGTLATVADGDCLGTIQFNGADNNATSTFNPAAYIQAYCAGTVGTTSIPGRLTFWTTAASGTSPTQRVTIGPDGYVGIGATPNSAAQLLDLRGTNNALTSDTAVNTLRFTDTDTTTAANQPIGKIEFYNSDTDNAAVGAYILSSAAGTSGGGTIRFGAAANAGAVAEVARVASTGLTVTLDTAGLGYGTGTGGAVTQATSRTTGVTLNKTNGAITLVSAAGSATWQSFTVTNSTVAATDVVVLSQKSGTDLYMLEVTAVAAGSFRISFATTGGTTTEQPVFNFAVIKAVAA
jgi:hypothetical protein